jgi:hypothetical protein
MLYEWNPDGAGADERFAWLRLHDIIYNIRIHSIQGKDLPKGWFVNTLMIEIKDPESAFLYKLTWG